MSDKNTAIANAINETGITIKGLVTKVSGTKTAKFLHQILAGDALIPILSDQMEATAGEVVEWRVRLFATDNGFMGSIDK